MSEVKDDSVVNQKESKLDDKEKMVSGKAYEDVSNDMHKYKRELKEERAAKNELQTQLKLQEEEDMRKNEKWKELYEKSQKEKEEEMQKLITHEKRFEKSVKIAALKQELGGTIKEAYLDFADLDSVTMGENGSIDIESLRTVANQYRKEHGQLIPKSDNTDITGQSASNLDNYNPKKLSDMSYDEKVAALIELENNKN